MIDPADWTRTYSELWRLWQSALGGESPPASSPFDPGAVFSNFLKPWLGGQQAPFSQADIAQWAAQALAVFAQATDQANAAGIGPDTSNDGAAPFAALLAFLRAPLNFDTANFATSGAFPNTGPWENFKPSDLFKLFDLPPLGINREWETKWRDVQDAVKAESEASAALGRLNAEIYTSALKQFLRALNERSGGDITSLRELYDFWIDTAEAAYQQKVMTQEYAKTFGCAVNASAARQKHMNTLFDAWRELINAPQRQEIDEIIATQHALAASLRELKNSALSEQSAHAFDARLDALADDVRQLRRTIQAQASTPKPAAPAASVQPPRQRKSAPTSPAVAAKRKVKTDGITKRAKPAKAKRGSKTADEFDIGHFN